MAYIGNQPTPEATQTRDSFTATASQTTFTTSNGYSVGFIDVFMNGVKLAGADYTATDGSTVVLASGAASGDLLDIIAYDTFNVANFGTIATQNANNVTITGGTIDGTTIGGTTAAAGSFTTLNTTSNITVTTGQYIEEYAATGTSGAVTIDLNTGNNFSTAMAGAVTYTFSNAATSGLTSSFTLKVVNDGNSITWPASVDWPSATAPTLSASGATDIFTFFTHDGGTTWYGFTAGQGMG